MNANGDVNDFRKAYFEAKEEARLEGQTLSVTEFLRGWNAAYKHLSIHLLIKGTIGKG